MRRSRETVVFSALAVLLLSLPLGGASAGGVAPNGRPGLAPQAGSIQELNFVFIPDPDNAPLGETVRWVNSVHAHHTTTGATPLSLWDSGDMVYRQRFAYTFTAAGQYRYLCTIHEQYDMVSAIRVRDQVNPPDGPAGTVFTVRVATIPAPTDYVYDVQKKEPGGAWQDWMINVTLTDVPFDSTGKSPGTYGFRSRLHRVSDDASSDYSPPAPVTVTP
jgi:plastocyanin